MSGIDLRQGRIRAPLPRRPLLSSCAIAAALVASGQARPVWAQSYNGTGSFSSGSGSIATGANTTNIAINGSSAVINWTATGPADTTHPNTTVFQGAGTTATFTGNQPYTVLNRIAPSVAGNAVSFYGNTNSNIFIPGVGNVAGGNVWFYSPAGIIVGSGASFNVGSLGLSTLPITDSDFLTGASTGFYHFTPGASGARITIEGTNATIPAAQINASHFLSGDSSYVALIAPRITQAGNVRADGSVAYIAAEAADITIHDNLFDIAVTQGAAASPTDSQILTHTGSTGGPTGNPQAPRAIYMVAIPKNNAITMLVGGNVGYDAGAAGVVNGVVVLSSGANVASTVVSGAANIVATTDTAVTAGNDASLTIGTPFADSHFSSGTTAVAVTDATVDASTRNATFDGDLTIQAGHAAAIDLSVDNTTVNVGGDLQLISLGSDSNLAFAPGITSIEIGYGAVLNVAGNATFAAGVSSASTPPAGGTVTLDSMGTLFVGQDLSILANGNGIDNAGAAGGAGTGGTITASLARGFTEVDGNLIVQASGRGGAGASGGNGTGGNVSFTLSNGASAIVNGDSSISADGIGGDATNGTGGSGTGGSVTFSTGNGLLGGGFFQTSGTLLARAGGLGRGALRLADGTVDGGNGTGGSATIDAAAGSINAGAITVDTQGLGADGTDASNLQSNPYVAGHGGSGTGGSSTLKTEGGFIFGGTIVVQAPGTGGNGGSAPELVDGLGNPTGTSTNGGAGGIGTGGTAILMASGGIISSDSTTAVTVDATGGNGGESVFANNGAGGTAFGGGYMVPGGGAHVIAQGGDLALGSLRVTADANGGSSENGGGLNKSAGGDAFAGAVELANHGDTITTSDFTLEAIGSGGSVFGDSTSKGGDGKGGTVNFTTDAGGTSSLGAPSIDASGFGGYSDQATGGDGTGGAINISIDDALTLSSELDIRAEGNGNDGGLIGGAGHGGSIALAFHADTDFNYGGTRMVLDASSNGGGGSVPGGSATGGTTSLTIDGATISIGANGLDFDSSATGYGTAFSVLTGGDAIGGSATLLVENGGSLTVGGPLTITARGTGGQGVTGGAATGGGATLQLTGGSLIVQDTLTLDASAIGGEAHDAGDGGNATGGTITVKTLTGGGTTGLAVSGTALFDASASAGLVDATGTGACCGAGGIGIGGTIAMDFQTGNVQFDALNASTKALGGVSLFDETSGTGRGGSIRLDAGTIGDGQFNAASLNFDATGQGGGKDETPFGVQAGAAGFGGTAVLNVTGGNFSAGTITLDASGRGGLGGDGGAGTGGTANVFVTGTSVLANSVTVSADGIGANGTVEDGYGGSGTGGAGLGGVASVAVSGNFGDLVTPSILVSASARGGNADPNITGQNGGAATGGTASVSTANNASVDDSDGFDLALTIQANAIGGNPTGNGIGGFSTGGNATLLASSGGTAQLHTLVLDASGGSVNSGGGRGGNALFDASGGNIFVDTDVLINADGIAANGGDAFGGRASFTVENGGGVSGDANYTVSARAQGNGGIATGGSANLLIDGPATNVTLNGTLTGQTDATNVTGATTGGSSALTVSNGATLTATDTIALSANGTGSDSGGRGDSTPGGAGIGGNVFLTVDGSTLNAATLTMNATGTGGEQGDGGRSGDGTGGFASVIVSNGGLLSLTNPLSIDVSGTGGDVALESGYGVSAAAGRNGGAGTGGTINIDIVSGSLTSTSSGNELLASGTGGTSADGGTGGNGRGGSVTLTTESDPFSGNAGSVTLGDLTVDVSGSGGSAADVGVFGASFVVANGGDGTGGSFTLDQNGADSAIGALNVHANAFGGTGQDGLAFGVISGAGGNSGSATGGSASINVTGGSLSAPDGINLNVSARGFDGGEGGDGDGGSGGSATGGIASFTLASGGLGATGDVVIDGTAIGGRGGDSFGTLTGGNGGAGGNAGGGTARIDLSGSDFTTDAFSVDLSATAGNGGDASSSASTQTTAGRGGDAAGGVFSAAIGDGTLTLSDLALTLRTTAGDGGTGISAFSPVLDGANNGDGGNAIGAQVILTANSGGILQIGPNGTDPLTVDVSVTGGRSSVVDMNGASAAGNGDNGFNGNNGIDGAAGAPGANGGNATAGMAGTAGGRGGSGGNGGSATGGVITLAANGGTFLAGDVTLTANATGGAGSDGGAGGFGGNGGQGGNGGAAGAGGQPGANGNGGAGGNGGSGGNGGNGGNGTGGTINLIADGGTLTTGSLTLTAMGTAGTPGGSGAGGNGGAGGNSGSGGLGGIGGVGGNGGNSGDADLFISSPGAGGPGGNGAASGNNGGFGNFRQFNTSTGGTANITVRDEDSPGGLTVGGATLIDVSSGGGNYASFDGGAVTIENDSASDNSLVFNGDTTISNYGYSSNGQSTTLNAFGDFGGGVIAFGGNLTIQGDTPVFLNGSGVGQIFVADGMSVQTSDGIYVNSSNNFSDPPTDTIVAGDFSADAGFIFGGNDGRINSAGGISINAGYEVDASSVSLIANNDIRVTSPGDVNIGDATAGDSITLDSGNNLTAGNLTSTFSNIDVRAPGDATIENATAANSITIDVGTLQAGQLATIGLDGPEGFPGSSITVTASGQVTIAEADAGEDVYVSTNGPITIGSATAGDDILLTGSSIDLGSGTTTGLGFDGGEGPSGSNIVLTTLPGGFDRASVDADTLNAADNVIINAAADINGGGGVSLGTVNAGYDISISGSGVDIGSATANGTSFNGGQNDGLGGTIMIDTIYGLVIGDADAAYDIDVRGGFGGVQANSLSARHDIFASGNVVQIGTAQAIGIPETGYGQSGIGSGGNINIVANTYVSVDSSSAGSDISYSSAQIDLGDLTAKGFVDLEASGAVVASSIASTGNPIDPDSSGPGVLVNAGDIITADRISSAGDINLNAAGDVLVTTDITANGLINATGTNVTLNAIDALRVNSATATDGDVQLYSGGDIQVSSADATGTITALAPGAIDADSLHAGNAIALTAGGDLIVGDAIVAADTGTVDLESGFDGNTYSPDGNIIVNGTVSAIQGVTINGGGDVTVNGIVRSDGGIAIQSGGDISVTQSGEVGTLGGLRSLSNGRSGAAAGGPSDSVTMAAGALRQGASSDPAAIVIDGDVDGGTITLASEAINIGSQANVGSAATGLLSFINTGTSPTYIGGAGNGAVYALADSGIARIHANAIQIVAPLVNANGGSPDVVVQQVDLTGSGASNGNLIGDDATFLIRTPGSVQVTGAVKLASAGSGDLLAISAGRLIQLVTPGGSIAVTGAGGALAGKIALSANTIFVSTPQAATDLASLTTVDDKDERLGRSDGINQPGGFLQANALEFRARAGLYIQNSGQDRQPSGLRGGFTVGSGGVTIYTQGTQPTEIIINGRQVSTTAAGGFVTGKDIIPLLTIRGGNQPNQTGQASFDPRSTANGCLIIGLTCRFDVAQGIPPVQDSPPFNPSFPSTVPETLLINIPVIDLVNFSPFAETPMIDEPVTGAGNEEYWVGETGANSVSEQVTSTRKDEAEDQKGNVTEQVTSTRKEESEDSALPANASGPDKGDVTEQVTSTAKDQDDNAKTGTPPGGADTGKGDVTEQVTSTSKDQTEDEKKKKPKQ